MPPYAALPLYAYPVGRGPVVRIRPAWVVYYNREVERVPALGRDPLVTQPFRLAFDFFPFHVHQNALAAIEGATLLRPWGSSTEILTHVRLLGVESDISSDGAYETFRCEALVPYEPSLPGPFYPLPAPPGAADREALRGFELAVLFGPAGERVLNRGVYADWLWDRDCPEYSDLVRARGLDFEALLELQEAGACPPTTT